MKSIRKTTTSLVLAGITLLGVFMCSATYLVTRQILTSSFDHDLLLESQNVESVSRVWPDGDFYIDIDFDVATQYNEGGTRFFQAWDIEANEVIDQSPMLEEAGIELPYPSIQSSDPISFYNLELPDGKSLRVTFQHIDAQWGWLEQQPNLVVSDDISSFEAYLLVGRDRTPLNQSLTYLQYWMFSIAFFMPVISFVVVYVAVGRGLQPLFLLAKNLNNIHGSNEKLSEAVDWPKEITPVVVTINRVLERLESSFQRERRFTSDAAHELRTPIAELRTATDVALRTQHYHNRLLTAVQHANSVSHSMANLVNAMLMLARFQQSHGTASEKSLKSHHETQATVEVDLVTLFNEQISCVQEKADERHITLQLNSPSDLIIHSIPGLLTPIFSNLISNAVEYTPPNQTVSFQLQRHEKRFSFTTVNSAGNITQADIDNFIQPFWRKAESRQQRDHFGLGLSITYEACQCLGLHFEAKLIDDRKIKIHVS